MVTPGRFELPTCGLGNRRSIHLSYGATLRSEIPSCLSPALPNGLKTGAQERRERRGKKSPCT